jgi:TonB family protein
MFVHGLRLLVALITFAVGVAASWLLGSGDNTRSENRQEISERVYVWKTDDEQPPPPPRSECYLTHTISGGILNGKAVSKPTPAYPPAARAARVQGTVVVSVVVDESGHVSEAEAQSGPLMLRDAAVDAAREARFSPTLLSGQPVKVSGVVTYNFWLQ